jgi:flagellar protein FliS
LSPSNKAAPTGLFRRSKRPSTLKSNGPADDKQGTRHIATTAARKRHMFSQASSFGRPRHNALMYQQVGVETSVVAASPHTLTLMLYDGLLTQLKLARQALSEGRVADKGRHIGRAAQILDEGLRSALDVKAGGDLALNLRDVYDYAQVRLLQANRHNDPAGLTEVIGLIEPVREAWVAIGANVPG